GRAKLTPAGAPTRPTQVHATTTRRYLRSWLDRRGRLPDPCVPNLRGPDSLSSDRSLPIVREIREVAEGGREVDQHGWNGVHRARIRVVLDRVERGRSRCHIPRD